MKNTTWTIREDKNGFCRVMISLNVFVVKYEGDHRDRLCHFVNLLFARFAFSCNNSDVKLRRDLYNFDAVVTRIQLSKVIAFDS